MATMNKLIYIQLYNEHIHKSEITGKKTVIIKYYLLWQLETSVFKHNSENTVYIFTKLWLSESLLLEDLLSQLLFKSGIKLLL